MRSLKLRNKKVEQWKHMNLNVKKNSAKMFIRSHAVVFPRQFNQTTFHKIEIVAHFSHVRHMTWREAVVHAI